MYIKLTRVNFGYPGKYRHFVSPTKVEDNFYAYNTAASKNESVIRNQV